MRTADGEELRTVDNWREEEIMQHSPREMEREHQVQNDLGEHSMTSQVLRPRQWRSWIIGLPRTQWKGESQ